MKRQRNKKKMMHSISRWVLIILIGSLVMNGLIFGGVYINQCSKLKKEAKYLKMPGQNYSIDGCSMHIYETGDKEAEKTLLFMHGTMATDSAVALRPLFDELKEDYHIIYIDRMGNGYSDVSGQPRDVETMLSQTRRLLEAAGCEGPYVLVPYYSAGLEALYWYQQYPEEVEAVVGIDMAYPARYQAYEDNWDISGVQKLYYQFCKIGGQRFVKAAYPDNDYGLYTEEEMKTRNALINRSCYTKDMYNEDFNMYENAKTIGLDYFPETLPMLQIISNKAMEPYLSTDAELKAQIMAAQEQDASLDVAGMYNKDIIQYLSGFENVTSLEIAGPTKLYEYCPDQVAAEIRNFLGK